MIRLIRVTFLWIFLFPFPFNAFSQIRVSPSFSITIKQHTDSLARTFAHLVTTDRFPCAGYSIRTRVTRERDTLSVYILGLLRPNPCLTGFDEAGGNAYLGSIGGGSYFLRVVDGTKKDLYSLKFEGGRITSISPIFQHFTILRSESP